MPGTEIRSVERPLRSLSLTFVLGALGSWAAPLVRVAAVGLTIIWGTLIISFVGGVRRGLGFGNPAASTRAEILTMTAYVSIGGIALILEELGHAILAVALLTIGYLIVPVADYRAAKAGNAPAHFAPLRSRQMSIAVFSLLVILSRLFVV